MNPQNTMPTSSADTAQDPLAQLQDIHLPDPIGLWPLAWGWWLLIVIVIASIATLIYFLRRQKIRNAYRALALKELQAIETKFSPEQHSEYLQSISILLRRTALSGFGYQFNASLKGEAWLQWLDEQNSNSQHDFSEGVGRALLIGPYQKNPDVNRQELNKVVAFWISHHRNQWQKKSNTKTLVKSEVTETNQNIVIDQNVLLKKEATQNV